MPQVVVRHRADARLAGQRVGPQGRRVAPGPALGAAQDDQPHHRDDARRRDTRHRGGPDPPDLPESGGGRDHPGRRRQVAVTIGGDLVGGPDQSRAGREDRQVAEPGRQQTRPSPPQDEQDDAEADRPEDRRQERPGAPVDPAGQGVHRDEVHRPERLDRIEPDPVARLGDPGGGVGLPGREHAAAAGRDGQPHEDEARHHERHLLPPDPPAPMRRSG